MRQAETSVRTASGQMRAVVYYPDAEPPLPGIVLVDGSGDSLAALEVLRQQPGVDPGRVGFLGISQGG
jgi:dienelactone hydrolase